MIGVIGPTDSVALVLRVATELRMDAQIIARRYRSPLEAPRLAAELEPLCSVLLFTGRVPFVISALDGARIARTEYIPHEGTDLYRAIAGLLLRPGKRGSLPRLSFDSIDADQIAEAFRELALPPPAYVIPLHGAGGDSVIDLDEIARQHRTLFEAKKVDVCVTCIGSVFRRLRASKARVVRIVHSRLVIRDALQRARLSEQLSRAQAASVAACVLQVRPAPRRSRPMVSTRLLTAMAEKYAQALDGRIVKRRADEIVVLATRGAVERILRAEMESRTAPLDTELREHVCVGFGFGASASIAEEQGRLAIGRAGTPAHVSIGLADQEAAPVPVEGSEVARTVRERDLRTLRRLRISPSVVRRLGTAFRRIDPASFTATEFAPAYGVDPRSARRLIAELKDRGLVRECGIEKSNRVGRPKRAYRIALNRLAAALR